MTALQATALALALLAHCSFAWGARCFFTRPSVLSREAKCMVATSRACVILQVAGLGWPGTVQGLFGAFGIVMFSLSLALYWLAIGVNLSQPLSLAHSDDLPQHLVTIGPYRYLRNPLYSAYLLAWFGGVVASGWLWLWLLPTALVHLLLYFRAAREEEGKFARSPLAAEHAAYVRQTGMFFPRWSALVAMLARFGPAAKASPKA